MNRTVLEERFRFFLPCLWRQNLCCGVAGRGLSSRDRCCGRVGVVLVGDPLSRLLGSSWDSFVSIDCPGGGPGGGPSEGPGGGPGGSVGSSGGSGGRERFPKMCIGAGCDSGMG